MVSKIDSFNNFDGKDPLKNDPPKKGKKTTNNPNCVITGDKFGEIKSGEDLYNEYMNKTPEEKKELADNAKAEKQKNDVKKQKNITIGRPYHNEYSLAKSDKFPYFKVNKKEVYEAPGIRGGFGCTAVRMFDADDYFNPDLIHTNVAPKAVSDAVTNATADLTINVTILTNDNPPPPPPTPGEKKDHLDLVSAQMTLDDNNENVVTNDTFNFPESDNPNDGQTKSMYLKFILTGESGDLEREEEDFDDRDIYKGVYTEKNGTAHETRVTVAEVKDENGNVIEGIKQRTLEMQKSDGTWMTYDTSILKPVVKDGVKMIQVFSANGGKNRDVMLLDGKGKPMEVMTANQYQHKRIDILRKKGELQDEPKSSYFKSRGRNLDFPDGCNIIMINDDGFQEAAVKDPETGLISYQVIDYHIKIK